MSDVLSGGRSRKGSAVRNFLRHSPVLSEALWVHFRRVDFLKCVPEPSKALVAKKQSVHSYFYTLFVDASYRLSLDHFPTARGREHIQIIYQSNADLQHTSTIY